MNVIVGATALGLEETEHPERMEECLNRIRGASEFLMGLLNDLVDMSKIETESSIFIPSRIRLRNF